MRKQRRTIQGRLLEPDSPALPALATTGDQREHLVRLVGALVLEVMTNPDPLRTGDDHESDHA